MRNSKRIKIVASATAVLMGTGVAFAYWTTNGSGTGSVSTSDGGVQLTVVQTSELADLHPGGSAQTIAGTISNQTETSAYVAQVVVSIDSVTQASGAVGTCDASDYTLAFPTMTVETDIAAGDTVSFSGATIKFNNKDSNQDGCKGATVNLAYAAS